MVDLSALAANLLAVSAGRAALPAVSNRLRGRRLHVSSSGSEDRRLHVSVVARIAMRQVAIRWLGPAERPRRTRMVHGVTRRALRWRTVSTPSRPPLPTQPGTSRPLPACPHSLPRPSLPFPEAQFMVDRSGRTLGSGSGIRDGRSQPRHLGVRQPRHVNLASPARSIRDPCSTPSTATFPARIHAIFIRAGHNTNNNYMPLSEFSGPHELRPTVQRATLARSRLPC
jgi:hypothetical protein